MRCYTREELDSLSNAIGAESQGIAQRWTLVIDDQRLGARDTVMLRVESQVDGATKIAIAPLDGIATGCAEQVGAEQPQTTDPNDVWATSAEWYGVVAAVRRESMLMLMKRCADGDPEPVLNYLRCCGVLVMD